MPTILVIDDSPAEAALMTSELHRYRFSTVVAANGVEGEAMAAAHLPELILLDIVMPGRDGFQTCRAIRKNPATKAIPIILVSSKSGESDKFWGIKQGANAYITKPFQPQELLAAIHAFLPADAH